MKHTLKIIALACILSASSAQAVGPYRNPDNKNLADSGEGSYPIPYKFPVVAEVTEQLHRVRGFMERATPTRIIDKASGQPITDFTTPVESAIVAPSDYEFGIMVYEMGVVHAGMMKAREVTGDPRFHELTTRHLSFLHQYMPYFREQDKRFKLERKSSFARLLVPHSLDDAGSMCAAMMRARVAGIGPDMSDTIRICGDWVANKQVRLKDGTLARNRPQAWSVWGDDMYMGIPALAELGRMTGERKYFDDAVKNALNMSKYLFNPQLRIYTHGWNANNPDAPQMYWGRSNGWAVLAMSDLLDVLPKTHPGYPKVLAQLRLALRGIAQYQSGAGLWHQMIDRNDSYLETSASAMFVYAIAHAINQGWISPTTYGPIAQAGWAGVSARISGIL